MPNRDKTPMYLATSSKRTRSAAQKANITHARLARDKVADKDDDSDKENQSHRAQLSSQDREMLYERKFRNERKRSLHAQKAVLGAQTAFIEVEASREQTLARLNSTEQMVEILDKQLDRTQEANTKLRKNNHALTMRVSRAHEQQGRAVAKVRDKTHTLKLKEKGVVKDGIRDMTLKLDHLGVTTEKIGSVINCVAEGAGLQVDGSISGRTVRRVIKEGGVAAQLQIAEVMKEADNAGITLSGDGTTHKNVNRESQHTFFIKETGEKSLLHLGVHSSTSHTAEKQLHGLQEQLSQISTTYNETLGQTHGIIDERSFPLKLRGLCADHAADQKLLAELLRDWKLRTNWEVHGEEKLLALPAEELINVLSEASQQDIQAVGGIDAWNALSDSKKSNRNAKQYQELCSQLGQEIFSALSPEEREESEWFVRIGCCMHKELNSVKGGTVEMVAVWLREGIEGQGPMRFFNKDNSGAYQVGDEVSRTRAADASQSGAVKLTSLAGLLFNHKDDKKGHQGSLSIFFEGKLGHSVKFPDTSNTRYQSHCEAAAELLVHRELYIAFLEEVKEKKDNRTLNNLELNVYQGLQDLPTLSVLAVLALFAHNLGPLHKDILGFMHRVIEDSDIIIGLDATQQSSLFDKKVWDQPELFYLIDVLKSTLPHLKDLLVAFFTGVAETCVRFTSEYETGGTIDKLSPERRLQAWMLSTNDINLGALGRYRVTIRRNPNMTEEGYNSSTMSKLNGTLAWMEDRLTSEDRAVIRRRVRKSDEQQLERKRRKIQAEYNAELVRKKKE
ncbi:hypothetical protein M422DRAFT_267823 [Sphaerobolus stellatus SS14]|uniref:Uncharacterized protein n=1 Tax=Sphaerobolus stellatus (strain SS14) TaxID=990650 RepID=A0A0C9UYT1_SPHS4|nr:hypothetical protein M422DRAFT_267823 [Sphaerobolus stellatus SS14]